MCQFGKPNQVRVLDSDETFEAYFYGEVKEVHYLTTSEMSTSKKGMVRMSTEGDADEQEKIYMVCLSMQ